MSVLLTDEDLVRITGRRRKALQIKELDRQGIPYSTDAFGRPWVAASAVADGKPGKGKAPAAAWSPRVR